MGEDNNNRRDGVRVGRDSRMCTEAGRKVTPSYCRYCNENTPDGEQLPEERAIGKVSVSG